MISQHNINRYLYISGAVLLLAGTIDPMEGSILIAIGSLLLALATYRRKDGKWKFFLTSFIMITMGVIFLFYLSSLGGFGGNSPRSWWWGLLILPYPIGWLMDVLILVNRAFKKPGSMAHG